MVQNVKALVTGAAGFLGSHVAEHCLKMGMDVIAVDDLSGGRKDNVPCAAKFVQGDLKSEVFVKSLWDLGSYDFVYHLAAYAAEGLSHFIRRYNYETNLMASINLINQSVNHEVKCFVFTSSIAVYGSNQLPMREDMTPVPEDPYGVSKLAVEYDLAAAHRMFGLNHIIFRPHNVYGERQNINDKYRNVIGIFMRQCIQGHAMTVFGDGLQTRAFSHIDDVAPIISRAPLVEEAYNQIFNIGADRPYTIMEIAGEIAKSMNTAKLIELLPSRHEVVHAFSDHSKVKRVFNPPDVVPLNIGIQRMAHWALTRKVEQPSEFGQLEIEKNLPRTWKKQS